jgi:hypothetical protein
MFLQSMHRSVAILGQAPQSGGLSSVAHLAAGGMVGIAGCFGGGVEVKRCRETFLGHQLSLSLDLVAKRSVNYAATCCGTG